MTEEQRQKCNALTQELQEAGVAISLHQFRTTSGYRVVGTDPGNRRFQRDGDDPVELLTKMKRVFGIKDEVEVPDPPKASNGQNTPEEQQQLPQ